MCGMEEIRSARCAAPWLSRCHGGVVERAKNSATFAMLGSVQPRFERHAMLPTFRHMLLQLFDPRGRASRSDFLAVGIVMLVLQGLWLAIAWQVEERYGRMPSLPVNLLFLYMAVCATTRRLHDTGRSAWWMPLATLGWALAGALVALVLAWVLGPERLRPGSPPFWLVFLILLAPALVAVLWLHLEDGDGGPNRFGPSPDEPPHFPKPRRTPKMFVESSRIAARA